MEKAELATEIFSAEKQGDSLLMYPQINHSNRTCPNVDLFPYKKT